MPEKSPGHLDTDRMTLEGAIDAFLLSRRVGNATRQPLDYYDTCLSRFAGIVKHPLQPTTSRDDLRIHGAVESAAVGDHAAVGRTVSRFPPAATPHHRAARRHRS